MLYDKFKDERNFRKDFIRPLLNNLGFFLVTEYHGNREFGKDFVFSELHRFGGVRHYGAQVKHEQKIAQGSAIDDLVSQINQAFANPFTLPDAKGEAYISALYIFNSGSITVNAKDDMLNRLRKTNYGENIYFLDGERLDSLNSWATFQRDQDIRNRLIGLKEQITYNIKFWNFITENPTKTVASRGSIIVGIEAFLTSPIFPEKNSVLEMLHLYEQIKLIDALCMRQGLVPRYGVEKEQVAEERKMCHEAIGEATVASIVIINKIDEIIKNLKPL